jgi:hypothetical protein
MPSCGGRKSRIQQIKGANHFGFGVRQQREFDPRIAGEMFDRRNRIIADRGDAVTERMESLDFFIPGDRLGLAGNSPIEGARKQNDQAAPPRQGFEIAMLAALICGVDGFRHMRADLGALGDRVETGGMGRRGQQQCQHRDPYKLRRPEPYHVLTLSPKTRSDNQTRPGGYP